MGLTPPLSGVGGSSSAPLLEGPSTPLPGLDTDKADPNTSLILDNADTFSQSTAGVWTGTGNVKVRYQGYTLTADRVDTDLDSGDTTFTGHVMLTSPDGQTVRGGDGGVLHLNLRRGTYSVTGAKTTVPAENVPVGIILPVFVYGGQISGRPGLIDARGASFTTCDFLDPHYHFSAESLHIRPGKRLTAHKVTLFRKDRRVFSIPYLVVPLNDSYARQTLFPQVGQTPDEGYFIKFALGYALISQLPGILHLDFLQRKGLGTGFEQNYGANGGDTATLTGLAALNRAQGSAGRKPSGTVSLYRLYDRATGLTNYNGSLSHRQTVGTVSAELTSQLQQNSYFQGTSQTRSLNSNLNLSRAVGNLSTSLRTSLLQSDYGVGGSRTLTSSFGSTFTPTKRATLDTRFDYSQYGSPGFLGIGATDNRALTTDLDYKQTGNVIDLELLGDKNTRIKSSSGSGFGGFSGGSSFGGVERLPELRLTSDAVRMSDLRLFLPRTTTFNLSVGQFRELTSLSPSEQSRFRFGLDLGQNTRRFDTRNSLDYGGSFQQGVYSDGAAQYVLAGRTGYRLQVGGKSSFALGYGYLRPYGFTPFQFDYAGSSNLASAALLLQENQALRLSFGTGFDFNRTRSVGGFGATPWQNVSFQSLYTPGGGNVVRLQTTTSYDLNHNTLLDITNSLRVRGARTTAFDLSSRYSPSVHKFSAVNADLDLPFLRDPNAAEDAGYRIRAIGGYNGLTSRFDYKGLALTRSWHDYEATLIYQDTPQGLRPGSTVTLNFRLKAFPDQEPFGIGQYGQPLDTSLGEVY